MGVLDEAIREHLELKRRHGAAEDELARAEAEALGPARRPAEPGAGDEEEGIGPGETLVVEPVADVAPPPGDQAEPVPPVHDIDEDPTAPPPAVQQPLEPPPAIDQPTEDFIPPDVDPPEAGGPGRVSD
jgi:hypothetical protein